MSPDIFVKEKRSLVLVIKLWFVQKCACFFFHVRLQFFINTFCGTSREVKYMVNLRVSIGQNRLTNKIFSFRRSNKCSEILNNLVRYGIKIRHDSTFITLSVLLFLVVIPQVIYLTVR
jgi:hypothetical protein